MLQRGHHDMGGRPAGPVERSEHDYSEWERRVDAISTLVSRRLGVRVDERRRNTEALPPEAYDAMLYYERWLVSVTQALIQRGVITTDELGRKMEQVSARNA
ncbi:MAG TPA: hypothetical protein VF211_11360 [Burkholderiales bacterium]